ncbi:MAG: small subunit ribosomal protein S17 [Planctomycetota bacterium]|jgi:small subunit ribosomal protein S17
MEKTITVRVERRYKHAKYGKFVRSHANYLVHDENSEAKEGDIVVIDSTRPISKKKRWRLSTVVTTGGLNETVVPGSDVAALLEDAQ